MHRDNKKGIKKGGKGLYSIYNEWKLFREVHKTKKRQR